MSESEGKSRLREYVEQIPEEKRRLHGSLTEITASIGTLMRENDMTPVDLGEELDRSEEYVHRLLGGGIDLRMRTIAKLETIFGEDLIDIKQHYEEPKRRRRRES